MGWIIFAVIHIIGMIITFHSLHEDFDGDSEELDLDAGIKSWFWEILFAGCAVVLVIALPEIIYSLILVIKNKHKENNDSEKELE